MFYFALFILFVFIFVFVFGVVCEETALNKCVWGRSSLNRASDWRQWGVCNRIFFITSNPTCRNFRLFGYVCKFSDLIRNFHGGNFRLYTHTHTHTYIYIYIYIYIKSNLSDKIKQDFFQVADVPIPLYGCTRWTLKMHREKISIGSTQECSDYFKLILEAPPTKKQLYGNLPLISKNI